MKKYLTYIAIILLNFAIWYLTIAFIFLKFNVVDWSAGGRAFLISCGITSALGSIAFYRLQQL